MRPPRLAFVAMTAVAACRPSGRELPPAATASAATVTASAVPSASTAPSPPAPTHRPPPAPQPDFTPGISKAPTVKEWNEAPVLEVRFARSLWCEAHALREWLRVSCRSALDAPNEIEAVTRSGGAGGEVYTFTRERVASAVVAVRKGVDVKLTYRWSKWGERTLSVSFPRDADRPRLGFDRSAPQGRSGLPRCDDVCFMPFHHHVTGACERPPPCEPSYRCETWHEGGESTGMCVCDRECDPEEEARDGTTL